MTGARLGMVGMIAALNVACSGRPHPEVFASAALRQAARQDARSTELNRVLALPQVQTEQGFSARVLVPPGAMYDPLFMVDHGNVVWINDDGGEEGTKGSQILAIDSRGKLSTVVALGNVLPVTGFDIAPRSFAPYEGQIFSVAFPEAGPGGVLKSNVIQRIDLRAKQPSAVFCTLPGGGADGKGLATAALEARFGPEGTAFAGKFFSVTAINYTVYQTTPDGRCTPFVTLDKEKWGLPQGLTFTPDGQYLLVSAFTYPKGEGAIARVRGDGSVESAPLVRSDQLWIPAGMAYAPANFGEYGGQLFVAVFGVESYIALQKTHAPPADGKVYRLTREGELKVFASQLHTPQGLHFVKNRLWLSDVNGDYISGGRELPDGFVIEITPSASHEIQ